MNLKLLEEVVVEDLLQVEQVVELLKIIQLQPLPAAPVVDAAAIDLFLTPLLGCGASGMRLGYGGGFYDRLFAQVGGLRLGVGFALQRVSDWESEAHDQRLDGFLSEEGLTLFD